MQKYVAFCGKRIWQKLAKIKNYLKDREHCYHTGKSI